MRPVRAGGFRQPPRWRRLEKWKEGSMVRPARGGNGSCLNNREVRSDLSGGPAKCRRDAG
jgi:hypothetical protein